LYVGRRQQRGYDTLSGGKRKVPQLWSSFRQAGDQQPIAWPVSSPFAESSFEQRAQTVHIGCRRLREDPSSKSCGRQTQLRRVRRTEAAQERLKKPVRLTDRFLHIAGWLGGSRYLNGRAWTPGGSDGDLGVVVDGAGLSDDGNNRTQKGDQVREDGGIHVVSDGEGNKAEKGDVTIDGSRPRSAGKTRATRGKRPNLAFGLDPLQASPFVHLLTVTGNRCQATLHARKPQVDPPKQVEADEGDGKTQTHSAENEDSF